VTVSQKKWDRAKGIIGSLLADFESEGDLPELSLKEQEQKVGFLVHLAMAYPLMFPFLRGFYVAMNSWREGRDKDGWKLPAAAYATMMTETSGGRLLEGLCSFC